MLRRLLPEGMEVPGAFEQVGRSTHVNLRDEHLPFKEVIGRVLDKNAPRIRSVVNKVETISEQGGDDAATTARRVFRVFDGPRGRRRPARDRPREWRSFRSTTARCTGTRGSSASTGGSSRCSSPATSSPTCSRASAFAVPAAMRGAKVYANDLNPQSASTADVDGNKVASRVAVSNLDGRAFVRHLLGTADGAAADGAAADGAVGWPAGLRAVRAC